MKGPLDGIRVVEMTHMVMVACLRAFRVPAMPIEFEGQPLQGEVDIAPLGADSERILAQLGYSGSELAELLAGPSRAR